MTATKMSFVTVIRPYIRLFYILGLSLFPLEYYLSTQAKHRRKTSKSCRFVLVSPTIIACIFRCSLCVVCLIHINVVSDGVGYTQIIPNLFLVCELLKTVAITAQNLFYANNMAAIFRNFLNTELLFESMIRRPIFLANFHRAFTRKVFVVFAVYAVALVFFVLYYLSLNDYAIPWLLVKIIHFLSIGVYLNATFFIDLITYHLKHLNGAITRDTEDSKITGNANVFVVKPKLGWKPTADFTHQQLFQFKVVHFHLWRISDDVNQIFGWTLIAMSFQSFLDFVYTVIWMLQMFNEKWNFISFMRKHFSEQ